MIDVRYPTLAAIVTSAVPNSASYPSRSARINAIGMITRYSEISPRNVPPAAMSSMITGTTIRTLPPVTDKSRSMPDSSAPVCCSTPNMPPMKRIMTISAAERTMPTGIELTMATGLAGAATPVARGAAGEST